ncbi:MAG: response regulator transcription factor [Prolixibacteraceae bacterium]|jgi:DNA-binding NarL/FixJ family response regulator
MGKTKVLVVDRSEIIRQGIQSILKTQSFNYEVSFSDSSREISDHLRTGKYNILLVNPSAYFDSKGERIKLLRQEAINFGFKLIALVYAYFDEQLLSLFDEVIYINDDEEKIFSKLEKIVEATNDSPEEDENANLSQRELDVVKLIALGKSNREIAEELFISIHTVISHRKNITNKLGIKSVSGLTIYAVINKLIGTEDFNRTV